MTREELLNLEHLAVAELKTGQFLHIHVEDGWRMTTWKEGDDIKNYSSFQCMYAPIKDEYADYRVIGMEHHLRLEEGCRKAIMELENNRRR